MTIRSIFRSAAAIIITTAFSTSCIETDKTTGNSLLPEEHMLKVQIAELNVPVQMKMADSLQTIFSGSLVVGNYRDPDFGLVQASSAFQFAPGTSGRTFGDSPVAKSFKMFINISNRSFFYENDQFIPQNFNLYRLTKDLDSTVAYSNSIDESHFNSQKLNKGGNVYFGGDSLVMDLSLEFAQELLSANQLERDSLKHFLKRFKGFYLAADPIPGTLNGGRMNIISPSEVFFSLEYTHKDATAKIDKDSTVVFLVSDLMFSVNRYQHSTQNLVSTNPQDKIFIEGFAGIKPFIDFTEVKKSVETWATGKNIDLSKLIISKAELRLPFEYPADYTRLNYYPSQVFLATKERKNVAGAASLNYEPVNDISFFETNGSINRSLKYYSLDISSYLHKTIKGQYTGDKLKTYITPILKQSDYYSGAVYYFVQNVLYSKAILNGNSSSRSPKLILTYAVMP